MAAQVARHEVTQPPCIIKKEERDILMSDISSPPVKLEQRETLGTTMAAGGQSNNSHSSQQRSTADQVRERHETQTSVQNDHDRSVSTLGSLTSLEKKIRDFADSSSKQNTHFSSILEDCTAILRSVQSDNCRLSGPSSQAESETQMQKRDEELERIKQNLARTNQALIDAKEENESTKTRLNNKIDALEQAKLKIKLTSQILEQTSQALEQSRRSADLARETQLEFREPEKHMKQELDNAKQSREQANQALRKERQERERMGLELSSKNESIRQLGKSLQCMTRDHAKKERQCEKLKEQMQNLKKKMHEQKAEKLDCLPMLQGTFAAKDNRMLSMWRHLQDTIKNMATLYLNNIIPLSQLSPEDIAIFEEVTAEYETVGTTKGQVHYLFQAIVWKFISDNILSRPTTIWGGGYAQDVRDILESCRCKCS